MIFAAGLGTRLKPLTDRMPKALVEVSGEPLLRHVILRLKDAGFGKIVVNVHHFSEQIISYLDKNENFGLDISISDESGMLLDTGGGLKKAFPLFAGVEPVLVHNVDILSNVDVAELYDTAVKLFDTGGGHGSVDTAGDMACNDDTPAALLLVSDRKTSRYLLFDNDMRLVGWTNVATGEVRSPYPDIRPCDCLMYAFSGIHVVAHGLIGAMQTCPDKFPIMDFYIKNCGRFPIKGLVKKDLRLLDVGKLDTLAEAEAFI